MQKNDIEVLLWSRMALQISTNAIKFALWLVDVVGYQSHPVSCFTVSPPTTWGIRTTPSSPAGCWRRTMALLLSSSTSAPGWTSAALFAMICQCSLPSCWQMSCQITVYRVYRVYECMNSSHMHLASSSDLQNLSSRIFPFNSKIRPKVPDPILKIPHWSHANSARDHQKLYAQLYGSPEPRPIDQQNSEICRAEAATREPALIGLLFVECSLPKNLTGKFWFKTHQIPSITYVLKWICMRFWFKTSNIYNYKLQNILLTWMWGCFQ